MIKVLVIVDSEEDVKKYTGKNRRLIRNLTWDTIGRLIGANVDISFISKDMLETGCCAQSADVVLNMSEVNTDDILPIVGPVLMSRIIAPIV